MPKFGKHGCGTNRVLQSITAGKPDASACSALGVTPDHLSRRCRAATGLGAQDLVQERLMLEGRRLLAYTPGAVAEIAHQLGFDDPAYFSRVFAKGAGQSPSAYREATALGLGVLPEIGAN